MAGTDMGQSIHESVAKTHRHTSMLCIKYNIQTYLLDAQQEYSKNHSLGCLQGYRPPKNSQLFLNNQWSTLWSDRYQTRCTSVYIISSAMAMAWESVAENATRRQSGSTNRPPQLACHLLYPGTGSAVRTSNFHCWNSLLYCIVRR